MIDAKNCIITWIDGTKYECKLQPLHIANLLELACVLSVKEKKKWWITLGNK